MDSDSDTPPVLSRGSICHLRIYQRRNGRKEPRPYSNDLCRALRSGDALLSDRPDLALATLLAIRASNPKG